jgi:hypothetical protein
VSHRVARGEPGDDREKAGGLEVQLEDLDRFAKEVIPAFRDTKAAAATQ